MLTIGKTLTQPTIACSNITIGALEQGVKYVRRDVNGAFIVKFKHVSHLILLFLLLNLSR